MVLYWIPAVLLLVTALWWRQSRRAHLRGLPAPFTRASRKNSDQGRRP